jgi:hypothetical protein
MSQINVNRPADSAESRSAAGVNVVAMLIGLLVVAALIVFLLMSMGRGSSGPASAPSAPAQQQPAPAQQAPNINVNPPAAPNINVNPPQAPNINVNPPGGSSSGGQQAQPEGGSSPR